MIDPNDPRLTAYALGELDEQETAEVAALVARSPEAAQAVADIRDVASQLASAFVAEADREQNAPASAAFAPPTAPQVAADSVAQAKRRPSWWRKHRVPLAIAATLAFAATVWGVFIPLLSRYRPLSSPLVAVPPSNAIPQAPRPADVTALSESERKQLESLGYVAAVPSHTSTGSRGVSGHKASPGSGTFSAAPPATTPPAARPADNASGTLIEQALKAKKERDFKGAVAMLDKAIALDPDNQRAKWMRNDIQDVDELTREYSEVRARRADQGEIAAESKIPWHELLKYPDNWLEITGQTESASDDATEFDYTDIDVGGHDDINLDAVADRLSGARFAGYNAGTGLDQTDGQLALGALGYIGESDRPHRAARRGARARRSDRSARAFAAIRMQGQINELKQQLRAARAALPDGETGANTPDVLTANRRDVDESDRVVEQYRQQTAELKSLMDIYERGTPPLTPEDRLQVERDRDVAELDVRFDEVQRSLDSCIAQSSADAPKCKELARERSVLQGRIDQARAEAVTKVIDEKREAIRTAYLNSHHAMVKAEERLAQSRANTADLQKKLDEYSRILRELEALQREQQQLNNEAYDRIVENPFLPVADNPLSTFSIDVDTASYSNMRRFLNQGQLPPPDAIRLEELINYFTYAAPEPDADQPFSVSVEVADCPWTAGHRLAKVSVKGYDVPRDERPASNLVFLVDVSGSMNAPNKLPLVQQSLRDLVGQLDGYDRVGIVTYAGESAVALESTPCDDRHSAILAAIDGLRPGGSTNGSAGIERAYRIAAENFIPDGVNRVILATDGDFNVGITDRGALEHLIVDKAKRGVFLSVLGFGMGNLKDATLEQLADQGNGHYAYIDTPAEARKVLVEQLNGTLITIAKDVKIQVEFNPAVAGAYRLLGYENRMLAARDFNDDKKDAGEVGAGHSVTALYEIVPAGRDWTASENRPDVDPLKYQATLTTVAASKELMTVKLRYKPYDGDTSRLIEVPVNDAGLTLDQASPDFHFAAAVASFGMLLRGSRYAGNYTCADVLALAETGLGAGDAYRSEFLDLITRAQRILGQ
ncbi:MAG TPA: von Willebrand factor type A domain-containing protein [Phycisphaerae bacterium]|nr:von Willebrand factor type A domain-containing protein [Phycisphaerae bacterium]